jgi:hypothetical protein
MKIESLPLQAYRTAIGGLVTGGYAGAGSIFVRPLLAFRP